MQKYYAWEEIHLELYDNENTDSNENNNFHILKISNYNHWVVIQKFLHKAGYYFWNVFFSAFAQNFHSFQSSLNTFKILTIFYGRNPKCEFYLTLVYWHCLVIFRCSSFLLGRDQINREDTSWCLWYISSYYSLQYCILGRDSLFEIFQDKWG